MSIRIVSRRPLRAISGVRFQSSTPTPQKEQVKDDPLEEPPKPQPYVAQPLRVALGVPERPLTSKQLAAMPPSKPDILDYDKTLERRKVLIGEVTRGYFHDFNEMRRHGGKIWHAPSRLIKGEKSKYMPTIKASSLLNGLSITTTDLFVGKVSLMLVFSTRVAEEHTNTYKKPWLDAFPIDRNEKIQLVQLNTQENILKSLIVTVFRGTLRRTIPRDQQATYLISSEDLTFIRKPTGMVNATMGYAFLIDESSKIRWAACGIATEDEIKSLIEGAKALERRLG